MKNKVLFKSLSYALRITLFAMVILVSSHVKAAVTYPTITTSGSNYMAVEYLLYARGYNCQNFDGTISTKTRTTVRNYQRANRLTADGIPGPATISKLIKTIRYGDRSYYTVALQILLNKHGFGLTLDGVFGSGTRNALVSAQRRFSISADGVCGPTSWRYLFGMNPSSTNFTNNGKYNRTNAISYASGHWNDGKGLCAEFVSNCLKSGGISVPSSVALSCSLMRNWLINNVSGHEYRVSYYGGKISRNKCPADLNIGDIVFFYCSGCKDGRPYVHVVMANGYTSDGYLKAYSHNSANNAKNAYSYSSRCPYCKGAITQACFFHFY